jgi:2-oxo-4-hydroxy-4-carboxy-5-ureidoimidazoline decarboxylase
VTLAEINAADQRAFVAAVGWVFEHSPWVAERAWSAGPFTSLDHLHQVMAGVALAATAEEQLALLRAHPDLGVRAAMSEASVSEQQDAGLDRLAPADYDRLRRLNAAYRQRFGIPFIFAVKHSTVAQILEALERRLPASPGDERAEALIQVTRIARFRLDATISA